MLFTARQADAVFSGGPGTGIVNDRETRPDLLAELPLDQTLESVLRVAAAVEHLTNQYLYEMAEYFAALDLPYPPPQGAAAKLDDLTHVLSDAEIAAVVTYIRGSWGNTAGPVSQLQVMQYRGGRAE